jgi:hypothetical protein
MLCINNQPSLIFAFSKVKPLVLTIYYSLAFIKIYFFLLTTSLFSVLSLGLIYGNPRYVKFYLLLEIKRAISTLTYVQDVFQSSAMIPISECSLERPFSSDPLLLTLTFFLRTHMELDLWPTFRKIELLLRVKYSKFHMITLKHISWTCNTCPFQIFLYFWRSLRSFGWCSYEALVNFTVKMFSYISYWKRLGSLKYNIYNWINI